jgi:hypothetical protein
MLINVLASARPSDGPSITQRIGQQLLIRVDRKLMMAAFRNLALREIGARGMNALVRDSLTEVTFLSRKGFLALAVEYVQSDLARRPFGVCCDDCGRRVCHLDLYLLQNCCFSIGRRAD